MNKDVEYIVGQYETAGVVKGVDRALPYLHDGASAAVNVSGKSSMSEEECKHYGLPEDGRVEFLVTVQKCESVSSAHMHMYLFLFDSTRESRQSRLSRNR